METRIASPQTATTEFLVAGMAQWVCVFELDGRKSRFLVKSDGYESRENLMQRNTSGAHRGGCKGFFWCLVGSTEVIFKISFHYSFSTK